MSKERQTDFVLPKLDELFTSQSERDNGMLPHLQDIPLSLLDDFPNHPFKVRDDEDMLKLTESITERGVLVPAIVRPKADGRYELISGHRRKRASEYADKKTLRCIVSDLDDDAATIIMVDSNIQRSNILPSEKAFAYKMRLDAMNRQGKRNDLTWHERTESTSFTGRFVRLDPQVFLSSWSYAGTYPYFHTYNASMFNRNNIIIDILVNKHKLHALKFTDY